MGEERHPQRNPTPFDSMQQFAAEQAVMLTILKHLAQVMGDCQRIYATELLAKDKDGRPCFIRIGEVDMMKGDTANYGYGTRLVKRYLDECDPLEWQLAHAMKQPRQETQSWE